MRCSLLDSVELLLTTSATYWFPDQNIVIARREGVLLVLESTTCRLTISRAPQDMPFNWVVQDNGRTRTAASVVGLLQVFRLAFSDDYAASHLRIAPLAISKE